jgi:hypothetical protein
MKVYIMMSGDVYAGIFPLETEIDLQIEFEDDEKEYIRAILKDCFTSIYAEVVEVEFEEERDDWLELKEDVISQENGI